MAKNRGAYKSAKRQKELLRQKKQEEKRLRRQLKKSPSETGEVETPPEGETSGSGTPETV